MPHKNSARVTIPVLIFSFAIAAYMLFHIIISPGHVLINDGGDAIKNYYTYLYQALYGDGWHSMSMNYPFGEHVVYTDGQPLLAVTLNYLGKVLPININAALAVMHIVIFLGFVLAVVYTYKILVYQNMRPLWAMLFAALIVMLCPQYIRIKAHFGLSYACCIPMILYWLNRYNDEHKWKYLVYYLLLGCIILLLHPYNAGICFIIGALYTIGNLLFAKGVFSHKLRRSIPVLLAAIGIVLFFKIFLVITDPVTDRPAFPAGGLSYVAAPKDIFTSGVSPVWKTVAPKELLGDIDSEGYGYVGIVALSIVAISLILFVAGKVNKKGSNNDGERTSGPWLFVAVISLLLAMGVPFIWHMEWLFKYTLLFRQFRTLGRLNWVFYYIVTIYAAIVLYRWYMVALLKRKMQANALLLLVLIVWGVEANANVMYMWENNKVAKQAFERYMVAEVKDWGTFMQGAGRRFSDFQAVLYLPYTNVGTEKIRLDGGGIWLMRHALSMSLKEHLPMVNAILGRSSLSQAEEQVRLAGGAQTNKSILSKMPNNKPLLLLQLDDKPADPDEQHLLNASALIGHYIQYNVYACYPERILANEKNSSDTVKYIAKAMQCKDSCITYKGPWVIEHFDKMSSQSKLFGTGAMQYANTDSRVVAWQTMRPQFDMQLYEFSYWVLLNPDDYLSPDFIVEMLDSTGNLLATEVVNTYSSTDNNNLWFRGHTYFKMPLGTRSLKCTLIHTAGPSYIALDELMVRPADALIISRSENGALMVNNHLY